MDAGRPASREAGDRQDVSTAVDAPEEHDLTAWHSRHIPCVVVQGRYDVVCPVRSPSVCLFVSSPLKARVLRLRLPMR